MAWSRCMIKAVTTRDALKQQPVPVLIECLPGTGVPLELGGRGRAPEGYIFEREHSKPVRTLSWDFSRLLSGKHSQRWERFCRAYGVALGKRELANLLSLITLKQVLQHDGGLDFRVPSGRPFRMTREGDQVRIVESPLIQISPTIGLRKYIEVQSRVQEKASEQIYEQLNPEGQGSPRVELTEQIDKRTKSGRLVLWWSLREMKFKTGLYFSDIKDAIYALFALQIVQPEGVGICERCEKVFKRTRVAQRFCSVKCGNCVRKKRQRSGKGE